MSESLEARARKVFGIIDSYQTDNPSEHIHEDVDFDTFWVDQKGAQS